MIENESRPCAAHNRISCWCLKNDSKVRTPSELAEVRRQLNPPLVLPAPSAPATTAAEPQKEF